MPYSKTAFAVTAGISVILGSAVFMSPAGAATTTTSTISPTDDTDVTYERSTLTNGSANRLRAGTSFGETKEAYVKFTVGPLASGAKITKATLRLTRDEEKLPPSVSLWALKGNKWSESKLTAATRPAHDKLVKTAKPVSTAMTLEFDVTAVVPAAGVYAFSVTSPDGLARFRSKEYGAEGPKLTLTVSSPTASPSPTKSPTTAPTTTAPTTAPTNPSASPTMSPSPTTAPTTAAPTGSPTVSPTTPVPTTPAPTTSAPQQECATSELLVPACGLLWGVAPGAFADVTRTKALQDFEAQTRRKQDIYHGYHRGTDVFPTQEEINIAREPGKNRVLMLNYNPTSYSSGQVVSWAEIAAGKVDPQLDKIAANIRTKFPEKFFLVIHHEPEEEVRQTAGSGWTAEDYAAMYRHVIERLRSQGVTNAITVMAYMSYEPWNSQPWFDALYPGDDIIDWIGWDAYAYSDPGKWAYGDFSELLNRGAYQSPWQGLYAYSEKRFPHKPLMLAEWGVWYSANDPLHQADFYRSVQQQVEQYPRLKALVYFDTHCDQRCMNSLVTQTPEGLKAYTELGALPAFKVKIKLG